MQSDIFGLKAAVLGRRLIFGHTSISIEGDDVNTAKSIIRVTFPGETTEYTQQSWMKKNGKSVYTTIHELVPSRNTKVKKIIMNPFAAIEMLELGYIFDDSDTLERKITNFFVKYFHSPTVYRGEVYIGERGCFYKLEIRELSKFDKGEAIIQIV